MISCLPPLSLYGIIKSHNEISPSTVFGQTRILDRYTKWEPPFLEEAENSSAIPLGVAVHKLYTRSSIQDAMFHLDNTLSREPFADEDSTTNKHRTV